MEDLFALFLLAILFFIPYTWIHFYAIQLGSAWKKRGKYARFLTFFSIITFSLFVVASTLTTPSLTPETRVINQAYLMGLMSLPLFFLYAWIHFLIFQFQKNWSQRSGYEKFLTVLIPVIGLHAVSTFLRFFTMVIESDPF